VNDRAVIGAATAGAVFVVICCTAPFLSGVLRLAGLDAWLAGAGLVVLPLVIACFGLVAWGIHRRRAGADCGETKIHKGGLKP